jgi:murein DD-endopeptidase MepM/ murein hydrolase activator NlpD
MTSARKALLFLTLLVAAVVLRNNLPWEQITLPFRAAKLYTLPPDTTLPVPVKGVSRAAVANTWHASRSGGRKHEGLDIFARRGTPVPSATMGIVIRLGGGELGGNAVFVLGPGGRTYYYAHLDEYAPGIRPGLEVKPGDTLGYVGTTGNARGTPPHLHFGIYTPTGATNPYPLLRDSVM